VAHVLDAFLTALAVFVTAAALRLRAVAAAIGDALFCQAANTGRAVLFGAAAIDAALVALTSPAGAGVLAADVLIAALAHVLDAFLTSLTVFVAAAALGLRAIAAAVGDALFCHATHTGCAVLFGAAALDAALIALTGAAGASVLAAHVLAVALAHVLDAAFAVVTILVASTTPRLFITLAALFDALRNGPA
jgi:hypothetical protein